MKESTTKLIVRIGLGVIVLLFIMFGFFIKQPCDIDKVYLWCRIHPMSFFDIIGMAGFFGGAVLISGILPLRLYNPENSAKWNWIIFGCMFLSFILIWNL